MRILAFAARTAGPRPYENGLIDLAIVAYDDGEEVDAFYTLLKAEAHRSYRPDALFRAGVDFDKMSALGTDTLDAAEQMATFLEKYQRGCAVWAFDLAEIGEFVEKAFRAAQQSFDGTSDIGTLWQVSRALGVRNEHGGLVPRLANTLSILNYYGLCAADWQATDALERAKATAIVAAKIIAGIRDHARGKTPPEPAPATVVEQVRSPLEGGKHSRKATAHDPPPIRSVNGVKTADETKFAGVRK